jgi:hypothetical protein
VIVLASACASTEQDAGRGIISEVDLAYPAGWQTQHLSFDQAEEGVVLQASRDDPPAVSSIRTVVGALPSDFSIEELERSTAAALRNERSDLDLLDTTITQVEGHAMVMIEYRTMDTEPVRTLMAVIPQPAQTFYVTTSGEENAFDRIRTDAVQIVESFAAYLAGRG